MPSNDSTMKFCRVCHEPKSIEDFPKHPTSKGGRMNTCRQCHAHLKKNPTGKNIKGDVGWEQETVVLNILRSMGVYALPGISTVWNRADVVAWGCVRIEVKSTVFKNNKYTFNLTHQHRAGKIKADVVVLCAVNGDECSYHVFKADEPVFYQLDGIPKSCVSYTPGNRIRRAAWHAPMTDERMEEARNAWHLIEDARQSIHQSLLNGTYIEPIEEQNRSRRTHAPAASNSSYR